MDRERIRQRAQAIGGNREAGAAELLAQLLPLLDEAREAGAEATADVVRAVCRGQPVMASLWNACAAAVADAAVPGRFARVRAELERAPRALVRVATAGLQTAVDGVDRPRLLTLSYSSSVAAVLRSLRHDRLEVVIGESLPSGEGRRQYAELRSAGVACRLVADAELTTYLPGATAGVTGADALGASTWINKSGTLGLSAAAHFSGVPIFVVASRDKARAGCLPERPLPRTFEATPVALATLFLTDAGPVGPDAMAGLSERFAADLQFLLPLL